MAILRLTMLENLILYFQEILAIFGCLSTQVAYDSGPIINTFALRALEVKIDRMS
jgi:hypothetical protein